MNADEKVPESIKYLIVTSRNVDDADNLLSVKVPDWRGKSFVHRWNFLKSNFKFNMCSRFTMEADVEKRAREDYYATLQYLISEAKEFGIASVI